MLLVLRVFFFFEVFLIFLFKEKVFEEDVLTLEDKHTGIIFGYGNPAEWGKL